MWRKRRRKNRGRIKSVNKDFVYENNFHYKTKNSNYLNNKNTGFFTKNQEENTIPKEISKMINNPNFLNNQNYVLGRKDKMKAKFKFQYIIYKDINHHLAILSFFWSLFLIPIGLIFFLLIPIFLLPFKIGILFLILTGIGPYIILMHYNIYSNTNVLEVFDEEANNENVPIFIKLFLYFTSFSPLLIISNNFLDWPNKKKWFLILIILLIIFELIIRKKFILYELLLLFYSILNLPFLLIKLVLDKKNFTRIYKTMNFKTKYYLNKKDKIIMIYDEYYIEKKKNFIEKLYWNKKFKN